MLVILISSVFAVAFFGNYFVDIGLIPAYATIATEVLVYVLFIVSLLYRTQSTARYNFDIAGYYLYFLMCASVSVVVHQIFSLQPAAGLRLVLRFYAFYLALINLDLRENDMKRLNNFIIILFLIQLPASATRFYLHGVAEKTHGIYGEGGGLTTILPLIALGYLGGFYLFFKQKKIYLILGICFIFYGIVGAKAALLFLFPAVFVILYYLGFIKALRINFLQHVAIVCMLIILSGVAGAIVIKLNPRLNRERIVGGTIDFTYAFNYSKDYTTAIHPLKPGVPIGRVSTTQTALEQIWRDGFPELFIGYGPGAITHSVLGTAIHKKLRKIDEGYGMTGFVYILLEYGILGVIAVVGIFLLFIRRCVKWLGHETDGYWKAFALGCLSFAINNTILFFIYNKLPIAGDIVPPLFFYTMAVAWHRMDSLKETEKLAPAG